jgi:hypothetical protein
MIRLFIKECLLFGSVNAINRVLGTLAWGSIMLWIYAMVNLLLLVAEIYN